MAGTRGALISLEGGEGAGKTTVLGALRARLEARPQGNEHGGLARALAAFEADQGAAAQGMRRHRVGHLHRPPSW